MAISALYGQYFQKSKIFLYPLLDIKKGSSVTPIQTYFGWNDVYTPEDVKLIAIYKLRDDSQYINFEKNILLKHSRLTDLIKLNEDEMLAVFDFSDLTDDWNNLLKGKYSKLTINVKRKISTYFQSNTANQVYINSYLYPKDYFEIYSELLQVDVTLLKEVGELCSKPDLEKEILYQTVQNLQLTKILD